MIVNNLEIRTLKGRTLLSGLSFVLNPGDKVGLIGEEGNGKSTLLKVLAGIDVSDYVTITGNIDRGKERIGYLPQTVEAKWLDSAPLEYLVKDEPGDEFPLESYEHYGRLTDVFKMLGIDVSVLEEERAIGTFSGGEKVRLSLARVMYQQPDVLLLDEPTNDLDLKTLLWLEDFINDTELPVLYITHDEVLLENTSNAILHLEQLKAKNQPRATFSRLPYRDYARERLGFIEKTNQISVSEHARFRKQMERYRQIYQKVEHRQNTISRQDPHGGQLLKKKMKSLKAQGRKLDETGKNLTEKYEPEEAIDFFFENEPLNHNKVILSLNLEGLFAPDGRKLAGEIHLAVHGRDKVCIIGDNGSGNTTLMKIIYQELRDRPDIILGYMPQNYADLMDQNLSAQQFLALSERREDVQRANTMLGAMKFTTEEMSHKLADLSEGQKCKIFLIKLILERCNVLLLDEPTRNLSPLSSPQLRRMLREYTGCIIAVSHDRKFIEEVSTVTMILENGVLKRLY